MSRKNASGVLLRRGLAHHVWIQAAVISYRQVPQLRLYVYPRANVKDQYYLVTKLYLQRLELSNVVTNFIVELLTLSADGIALVMTRIV